MDFVAQILASALINSVAAAAFIWLSKTWLSERLKGAIKSEYDQKLETHKAQLRAQSDVEVERLRSQLSVYASEHQVRFSKLHEKRGEVIAELYGLLVLVHWETSSFVSMVEWAGEPNKRDKLSAATDAIARFFRFFDKNRIYLPESICETLESFVRSMRNKANEFGVYIHYADSELPPEVRLEKHEAWRNAWEYFEKEVPPAHSALERELRTILGDR